MPAVSVVQHVPLLRLPVDDVAHKGAVREDRRARLPRHVAAALDRLAVPLTGGQDEFDRAPHAVRDEQRLPRAVERIWRGRKGSGEAEHEHRRREPRARAMGGFHHGRSATAATKRSGVIGRLSIRAPLASAIALAIAAETGTTGGSPTPFAPNGPRADGTSTSCISTGGTSVDRGSA